MSPSSRLFASPKSIMTCEPSLSRSVSIRVPRSKTEPVPTMCTSSPVGPVPAPTGISTVAAAPVLRLKVRVRVLPEPVIPTPTSARSISVWLRRTSFASRADVKKARTTLPTVCRRVEPLRAIATSSAAWLAPAAGSELNAVTSDPRPVDRRAEPRPVNAGHGAEPGPEEVIGRRLGHDEGLSGPAPAPPPPCEARAEHVTSGRR